jgi:hypothetical protein
MLSSTQAKSELFAKLSRYLSTKDGPIRAENLSAALLGIEWCNLAKDDQRILLGTLSRCGFEQGRWPHWFRVSREGDGVTGRILKYQARSAYFADARAAP